MRDGSLRESSQCDTYFIYISTYTNLSIYISIYKSTYLVIYLYIPPSREQLGEKAQEAKWYTAYALVTCYYSTFILCFFFLFFFFSSSSIFPLLFIQFSFLFPDPTVWKGLYRPLDLSTSGTTGQYTGELKSLLKLENCHEILLSSLNVTLRYNCIIPPVKTWTHVCYFSLYLYLSLDGWWTTMLAPVGIII